MRDGEGRGRGGERTGTVLVFVRIHTYIVHSSLAMYSK